jgi:thiamine biosynthesis lipoprotein
VIRAARILYVALLLAGGCSAPNAPHETRLEGEALGTTWAVTVVSDSALSEPRLKELRRRVAGTLDRVDRGMSNWRDDSELSRFNAQRGQGAFRFSPETRRVVASSLELARETGGAFDPTVAPLVALWGFGPGARETDPTPAELSETRSQVGWRHLFWDDEGRLLRRVEKVELDLSAIAKGYAVDAIVAELARDGLRGLLVEVGGEVRATGPKANGETWRVGIDDPTAPGSRLEAVVALTSGALATSGDYRQARIVDGERRTHVLDPRTGRPVQTGVASASVVAPTCMEADAVATALMVLEPHESLIFVEDRPWLEALLLIREGDRVVERHASSGWSQWVKPER